MRWLWFVASLICFAIVFKTPSIGLAVLCLLAALVFMLVGIVAVASNRIDGRSRDATSLLGPEELRRMREIEAKRRGGAVSSDVSAPMFVAGGVLLSEMSSEQDRHLDHDAPDDSVSAGDDGGGSDGGGDGGGGGGD